MKACLILLAASSLFSAPALAQMNNMTPTGGAAHAAVCRTSELKACKDLCKTDHDDNVRLLCSKNQPGDADCKKQQTKMMSQCNDGCQKKWCS